MDYNIVLTKNAEDDLDQFIQYLVVQKENVQAAKNVLDDFDSTIKVLKHIAGSLKLCEHPRLNQSGYRRINFLHHRYFMLFRIEDNTVIVDAVFHELQDYENRMK